MRIAQIIDVRDQLKTILRNIRYHKKINPSDETEYLLQSPANREHLLLSLREIEENKVVITDLEPR